MSKVVFSSWSGKVVDNRGLDKYASVENMELPLEHNGHQVRAFMSWRGLLVADEKVDIVGMAYSYLKEVQRLSCGECSVGYLGVKVMLDALTRMVSGQGTKRDVDLLRWLGSGIKKGNTKCDFCSLAVTPIVDTVNYYEEEYTKLIGSKGAAPKSIYITRVTAPCMEACPAHQDAPGYIELIRNRRYPEALEVIRKTNCFPGVTGRACVAFCEDNCVRGDMDKPIAIRALKRVPADYEVTTGSKPEFEKKPARESKVAVIGAGPAGLAASYNLALMGHKVTVYDEQTSAGGMVQVGIPDYRLPKDALSREVDIIRDLGVEVKLNTRVGKDVTLEQLSAQGFKAIFLAAGAHIGRELGMEAEGVVDGVKFLRDVNTGEEVHARDRVIIIGGGNVAIDCARTCLRLGFKDVNIVYRRSRAEMPARSEEVEAAESEGAKITFLAAPAKVLAGGDGIAGVECVRMELGEPDDSGRRRPIPVEGSEFTIETDMVIPAIGEKPDLSFIGDKAISTTEQGTVVIDKAAYQTSVPGIFAGGDCVTGAATIIEAIAAGNRAASSIDRYLQSGKATPSDEYMVENWLNAVALNRQRNERIVAGKERQSPEELAVADRNLNFNEVEQVFVPETAAEEAERCLRCYRVMLMAIDGEK
jgi:formate dehydrogenase beta subunit